MKELLVQLEASIDYLSAAEKQDVLSAMQRAIELHGDQKRESGEPYATHPIAVAIYLASLEAGRDTLIATLLHDVVEDDHITLPKLTDEFGETIAMLVDGVTKLSKFKYEGSRTERQIASLRKMLLSANSDLRIILIKLADRWHNIQTISALRPEKQMRIANETLEIYVPFARLVGLWELKSELEEICFPIAMPEIYSEWHEGIEAMRSKLQKSRDTFVEQINRQTSSNIVAREDLMTDYEVYQKLQGNISLLQSSRNIDTIHLLITDENASNKECYIALGEIHSQYPVLSNEFRDYISAPQPNGYRALHSTIFLDQEHQIRIRIQTAEMYEYATRRKLSAWVTDKENDVYRALTALNATSTSNNHEYIRDLETTVLNKRINVFTTSGEIISLPKDATGIDFAFSVNPTYLPLLDSVWVNGEQFDPTHVLHDGDTVELVLLEKKNGKNNLYWVNKVKSADTKESIRQSLKRSTKRKRHQEGKVLLGTEFQKRGMSLWSLLHFKRLQNELAARLNKSSFEVILDDIGTGVLPVTDVMDAYREIFVDQRGWYFSILKFFGLLSRSRVLNEDASLISIEVYAEDRKGLIHDVTRCFTEADINIAKFGVFAIPPKDALYKISLEVQNFDDFSHLYDSLLQIPSVRKILRIN